VSRLILLILFTLPSTLPAQGAARASVSEPEIVAIGSAEVRLRPDRATMTVSVMVRSSSASEAGRLNAERMAAVLAAIRRQGVSDSSIATSGFSIEVEELAFDQPAPPVDAPPVYVANNAVRLSLTNMESIGTIVDTVLAAGASGVGGISYASSENTEGRRRAIALAVAEARGDAEAAAEAAGGRLGALIELTLSPTYSMRGAAAASLYSSGYFETSILVPTTVSESATATLRFAFVPRR
jgi:uncharacterized protein